MAVQGKLETIREILVGEEFDSLQDQFQNLEKSLDGRYTKIHNELMAELEASQVHNKSEVKQLGEMVVEMVGQLQEEDNAHAEQNEGIEKRIDDLEKRVDDTKEALVKRLGQIHQDLSRQLLEFAKTIKHQQQEVTRRTVTRSDFAKLLNGLADRIVAEEAEATESE